MSAMYEHALVYSHNSRTVQKSDIGFSWYKAQRDKNFRIISQWFLKLIY